MTQPFVVPSWPRPEIPVGWPAGNKLFVPLQNDALPSFVPPLDWTTVTAVSLSVTRQKDATTATWSPTTLIDVTTGGLVAVYTSLGTEAYIDGTYFVRPYVTAAGISIPCTVQNLYVRTP